MQKMSEQIDPNELDNGEPDFIVGDWYQFAVPGGFLMFGRYVRPLGYGMHRFANVKHLKNAGQIELPAMTLTGIGRETVLTDAAWKFWNGCPIWFARCEVNPTTKAKR